MTLWLYSSSCKCSFKGVQGKLNVLSAWPGSCCQSGAVYSSCGEKSSHRDCWTSKGGMEKNGVKSQWNQNRKDSFLLCLHLFVRFALFSKGVTLHVLQEADGDVVDLLLVENGEGEGLTGSLVRAVANEEGTVLRGKRRTKLENLGFRFTKIGSYLQ